MKRRRVVLLGWKARGLLRQLADDTANPLDSYIVDDLRNFLPIRLTSQTKAC